MIKTTSGQSLIEQITDVWFAELESAGEFDASTVDQLKRLVSKRTVKPAQVLKAVKVLPEVPDETA
jgi:hypothetical protein